MTRRIEDDVIDSLFYSILMNIDNLPNFNDNEIMNESLYETNPIKMVITDEEKNKLVVIKYKDVVHKEQNACCFITQDEFSEEDDVIQLPCNHCFTPDSIMHWLTEECCECPICRYKFDSVEKRISDTNVEELQSEQEQEQEQEPEQELTQIENIANNLNIYHMNNIFLNNFMNTLPTEYYSNTTFYENNNDD